MLFEAELRKKKYQIIVDKTSQTWEVSMKKEGDEEPVKYSIPHKDFEEADNVISFLFKNHSYLIDTVSNGIDYEVYTRGSYRKVKIFNDEMLLHESLKSGKSMGGDDSLTSGMPGKIVKVMVSEGEEVDEGTPLLIMEAMKMENEMKAAQPGKIKKILVQAGDNVEAGASLIQFDK
ncbi:MAG: biotin/lipoyl-binding protein [Bdellovibrionales bacterium]|nr:acetyl-CoA carboxylase biotin carboxyl carrier protein subunit [Bdellovibrionales bacterium]NQZ18777.1 biotin/lipoyl-binding protein [Bdellovibrionales bacterium]